MRDIRTTWKKVDFQLLQSPVIRMYSTFNNNLISHKATVVQMQEGLNSEDYSLQCNVSECLQIKLAPSLLCLLS